MTKDCEDVVMLQVQPVTPRIMNSCDRWCYTQLLQSYLWVTTSTSPFGAYRSKVSCSKPGTDVLAYCYQLKPCTLVSLRQGQCIVEDNPLVPGFSHVTSIRHTDHAMMQLFLVFDSLSLDYLLSGGWLRIYITRPSLFCPKAHFQKPKKYALLCLERLWRRFKGSKMSIVSCLSHHSCDLIWNIDETNVTCQTQIVWSRRSERAWSRGSSPAKLQHRCTVFDIVKRFKWSHNKCSNAITQFFW